MIASVAGEETWAKVIAGYFTAAKNSNVRPFTDTVAAITKGDFSELVKTCTLTNNTWKETLCTICTYAPVEDFAKLCNDLGYRLEQEQNNLSAATLLYVCAANMNALASIWLRELNFTMTNSSSTQDELKLNFIEKVHVAREGMRVRMEAAQVFILFLFPLSTLYYLFTT